jgi:hypothetical protein
VGAPFFIANKYFFQSHEISSFLRNMPNPSGANSNTMPANPHSAANANSTPANPYSDAHRNIMNKYYGINESHYGSPAAAAANPLSATNANSTPANPYSDAHRNIMKKNYGINETNYGPPVAVVTDDDDDDELANSFLGRPHKTTFERHFYGESSSSPYIQSGNHSDEHAPHYIDSNEPTTHCSDSNEECDGCSESKEKKSVSLANLFMYSFILVRLCVEDMNYFLRSYVRQSHRWERGLKLSEA